MKRSRLDICIDVLQVIKRGCCKPTRIMYRSNISWIPLREILSFLISQGAVTVRNSGEKRKEYYITEKGRNILKYYEQFKAILTERTGSLPE